MKRFKNFDAWALLLIGLGLISWALFWPKPAPEPTRIDLSSFEGEVTPAELPNIRSWEDVTLIPGSYATFMGLSHKPSDTIYVTRRGNVVKMSIVMPRAIDGRTIYFVGEEYMSVGGNFHSLKSVKVTEKMVYLKYERNNFLPLTLSLIGAILILLIFV